MLTLVLVCVLGGCARTEKSYFSFREHDFEAEVTGALDGVEFCAVLSVRAEDGRRVRRVAYLGKGVLSGIVVEARADGTATLSREGMTFFCEEAEVAGLLSPIDLLLSEAGLGSVRRVEEETLLTLEDGTSLTLAENGVPRAASNGERRMTVVWWEQ